MTLPVDLEDWFTDVGDRVVRKQAAKGDAALSEHEHLIHEIWLLDTETRNGGLSQYFCNRGLRQWQRCVAAVSTSAVRSFVPFAARVAAVLATNPGDPYLAIVNSRAEDLYYKYQTAIVRDLHAAVANAP